MADLITSEIAFSEHMPFPPYVSRERMESYELNLKRFKGEYNQGKYIRIKNLNGGIDSFQIITENYFKLLTLKLQGLLLNEKPIISVKGNIELTDVLNKVVNKSGFWKSFLAGYRNFSSLGTGVLYLSYKDGCPMLNSINPKSFYKVVNPINIDEVVCYVLVQPIYEENYKTIDYIKIKQLRILFHYKGYYIERIFNYNENGEILDKVSEKRVETGLTDFAVFCMENCPPTDEVFGLSDYENIADIVGLYEQTFTLINAVLIKNINPILQVPMGVLVENEQTGKLEAPTNGSVVEADKDLKYITYDLQIQDLMAYIQSLLNELGIQTELSKTFMTGEFTSNLSGAAIKNLLKAPLDKISRSIDEFDDSIKALFVQMLHLLGYEVEQSDIEIVWRDGISGTDDDNLTVSTTTTVEEVEVDG